MNKNIRIEWDGPYSLEDVGYTFEDENYTGSINPKIANKKTDCGIYQVYGCHPVYGDDVLLYIGKVQRISKTQRTFAKRLAEESWEYNADSRNIKFYVGRLFDKKQIMDKEWDDMINTAEKMLIFAHAPAKNSSNILNITKDQNLLKEFEDIRVFNYDNHRSLMPEISGELWVKGFDDYKGVLGSNSLINS